MSSSTPESGQQPNSAGNPLPYGAPAAYPQQPGAAQVPAPLTEAQAPLAPAGAPAEETSPKRRRGKIIGWTAGVVTLALAGSVGGVAIVAQASQRGADTPQAAIERLDNAIRTKDKLELAKLFSAAEAKPFFENMKALGADSGLDKLASHSGVPFGDMDEEAIQRLLDSIDIKSSKMDFTISEKSSTIALAELKSWKLDMSIDKQKLVDAVAFAQERAGQKDTSEMRQQMLDSFPKEDFSFNGDLVEEARGGMSIVLAKEGDRWYVSPMLTVAQAAYQASGSTKAPRYDANVDGAQGAQAPAEAVKSAVDKMFQSKNPEDLMRDDFTALLALPERRLLMIYGPALASDADPRSGSGVGSEGTDTPANPNAPRADWKLSEYKVNDSLTIVGPGTSSFSFGSDPDANVSFNGPTVTSGGKSIDFGAALTNPQRLGIATVKENGTWRVSLLDTIINYSTLAGNDLGKSKAKELLGSLGKETGLDWESLDERTQTQLAGVLFFVAPMEQATGKAFGDFADPDSHGTGLPDGFETPDSNTDYGSDNGTAGEDPSGASTPNEGLGSVDTGNSLEANLGKLFGSN